MTQLDWRAGAGYLRIERSAGQSAATSVRASSPLKILVPRSRGSSVWACLSSLGGGLVAGDEISVQLHVCEQARCYLSTQASTKVYRNPVGRPCGHHLQARLERGAFLAVLPDPVQAFLGSRYCQRQQFSLAVDSGLVLVDWLCSGRAARGERWSFACYQSRNEVTVGGSQVLVDSLLLDPDDGSLEATYRLGRFNCLALVLVVGAPLYAASAKLLQDFGQRPISRLAGVISSASALQHGALLRFAGEEPQEVVAEILKHLAFVSDLLGDAPWTRKF